MTLYIDTNTDNDNEYDKKPISLLILLDRLVSKKYRSLRINNTLHEELNVRITDNVRYTDVSIEAYIEHEYNPLIIFRCYDEEHAKSITLSLALLVADYQMYNKVKVIANDREYIMDGEMLSRDFKDFSITTRLPLHKDTYTLYIVDDYYNIEEEDDSFKEKIHKFIHKNFIKLLCIFIWSLCIIEFIKTLAN